MNYVLDPVATPVQIPWCLEGAFVFNLLGAHVVGSVLHSSACRKWRLEMAMTGLCLLDLGYLMASQRAKDLGVKKQQVWLDARTHRSLRDLCGSVILVCWGADGHLCFPQLSERKLEKRFGRVRSCFSNSQMTVPDYWRASAQVARKELHSWKQGRLPDQKPLPEALSCEEFSAISSRSFAAALRFSSICSGNL